jgi:AcrR family transcriptional regulator
MQPLSPERRDRLLDFAAVEFAERGFHGASLNEILRKAGVPKGVAYYHFDDKADLLAAVAARAWDRLAHGSEDGVAALERSTFWGFVDELYRRPFSAAGPDLEVMRAVRSAGSAASESPALAGVLARVMAFLTALVRRGRALGVVRSDMPEELQVALVAAVDDAIDAWLMPRHAELAKGDLARALGQGVGALRRLLEPDPGALPRRPVARKSGAV